MDLRRYLLTHFSVFTMKVLSRLEIYQLIAELGVKKFILASLDIVKACWD